MRIEIERGPTTVLRPCPVVRTSLVSILLNKYRPNGPSVSVSLDKSWVEVCPAGRAANDTGDFDWGVRPRRNQPGLVLRLTGTELRYRILLVLKWISRIVLHGHRLDPRIHTKPNRKKISQWRNTTPLIAA